MGLAPKKRYLDQYVVSSSVLNKEISENRLGSVYLFYGPETYIKESMLARIREALLPVGLEDLNDTTLEGGSARQILDAADTLPMMCDKRVVVVRDWAPLYSGKSKNEDEDVKRVEEWMKTAPDTCCLIFYLREEPDEKKKAVQAFMDAVDAKHAEIVHFDYLSASEMLRWMNGYLKRSGKKIARDAADRLTMMSGNELNRLIGELDKLTAYTEDRPEITPDDVSAIAAPSLEYSTYELIDVLLRGDIQHGEEMLRILIQGGEKPAGIVSLMATQMRQYLLVCEGLEKREPLDSLQKWMGLRSAYQAKQIAARCRSLKTDRLRTRYELCVETDFAIKSGMIRESDALHKLVNGITSNK